MSLTKKKLFLNISEIASFIGKNPYDCIPSFERFWKKSDPEEYNKALNEINKSLLSSQVEQETLQASKQELTVELESKKITKRQYNSKMKDIEIKETKTKEVIKDLSEKVDNIKLTKTEQVAKALGKDAVSKIQNADIDTNVKREVTNKLIEDRDDLSEESKRKLLKKTENIINTTHGTLKEDSAIAQFESKFKVKLDTSQEYYKRKITFNQSNYDWYIGGKLDGIYIDNMNPKNSYLVEVKNRTKGFFSSLRDYEKCQIQLYMWIMNLDQARLVEQHNKKIKVTIVYRDDDFLEDIIESLEIFAKNVENKFLNNMKAKKDYLNKTDNEKNIFISKLYLSEISVYLNKKNERKIIEKEASEDCMLDDLDDF
jgi:hypothetical protein